MAKNTAFWIKVAPCGDSGDRAGPQTFGTLICEDREDAIVREAKKFLSRRLEHVGLDWRVEIRRPKGPPIAATLVAELLERALFWQTGARDLGIGPRSRERPATGRITPARVSSANR